VGFNPRTNPSAGVLEDRVRGASRDQAPVNKL